MQTTRSRADWEAYLRSPEGQAASKSKPVSQARPPAAPQASGTVREREERQKLLAADDSITRPAEPRGARAVVGPPSVAISRVRDKQRQAEEVQDAATPAQRAHNERAKVIDAYAQYYEDRKREEAEEQRRKQQAQADKIAAEKAAKANADAIVQTIVANDTKSSIRAVMRDHYDILEEVTALVKSWGPLAEKNPDYWQAAVNQIRRKQ